MRSALISIGVATLISVSMAWPQGRPADGPSRVPSGAPPATTDADVAALLRYEPTGLSLLRPYRRGRIPVIVGHSMGGLLAKMMVQDSGSRLWRLVSDRPFEKLEGDPKLADYGTGALRARRGADIRTGARAQAIEPGKLHLAGETIEAETIVLAAGIIPNPVVAELPVEKDRHGHILVDGTMRCPSLREVWALGDCAAIPAPPTLPQPRAARPA
jgi:NADPH-dependent 2,4-dienoyl-CoA reductase/sulfur reductase-like enzyme